MVAAKSFEQCLKDAIEGKDVDPEAFPQGRSNQGGLTKREWFAGQVAPVMFAEYFAGLRAGEFEGDPKWKEGVIGDIVSIADKLVEALSEDQNENHSQP